MAADEINPDHSFMSIAISSFIFDVESPSVLWTVRINCFGLHVNNPR